LIKRLGRTAVSLCVAALLSASILTPLTGKAAGMTASEQVIQMIKDYEGFRSNVYWDSGSAYIGYGTICRSTDYPNGISREKADALLREAVHIKEDSINNVLSKYGVQLTQPQFDALVDLSYNIGTAWMSSSSRMFAYLKNSFQGNTELEIVNAFGTWCHVGRSVSAELVERRIREAKIFLYGDYTGTVGPTYKYLTYEAGDGEVAYSIVFYEAGKTYGPLQPAVRPGWTLQGWYTPDGTKISPYSVVTKNHAVSALWTEGAAPVNTGVYTDVAAGDWYYQYVGDLSRQGIFSGYPDGSFQPGKVVTCGEALKLVLRAAGFDEEPAADGHWAGGYLRLAVAKGILAEGAMPDLNANITRLQVAEIAARAVGLPPLEPDATFADTTDGYVLQLYRCGIITGNSESGQLLFYPGNSINRGELSAILARMVNSGIVAEY
jgi:GH24 family phage-related lysozyme (muramidase)